MSILRFSNIKKKDSGIYECEFPLKNNEYSSEKISLNVTVEGKHFLFIFLEINCVQ